MPLALSGAISGLIDSLGASLTTAEAYTPGRILPGNAVLAVVPRRVNFMVANHEVSGIEASLWTSTPPPGLLIVKLLRDAWDLRRSGWWTNDWVLNGVGNGIGWGSVGLYVDVNAFVENIRGGLVIVNAIVGDATVVKLDVLLDRLCWSFAG